ncbi:MAG: hypothetical protein GY849_00755, partial [Deltaproteobacteria bacterium]|nr:hypothetical protein [Deltaproteobacteria bacterium]
MKRNLIVTVAIVPALIALVTAGCVDSGKEEERSETEVKKMVAQFPNRE